jgi:multicomponent Na+:H+ antiporter subunit D
MEINSQILLLPLITPLLSALISLFFWQSARYQRIIFLLGSLIYLFAAARLMIGVWAHGYVILQAGNWPAPYGIILVADLLSAGMILVTAILTFTSAIYFEGSFQSRQVSNIFHPILHFLAFGLTGAFLTGDIFNLYVWFEIMLVSSFVFSLLEDPVRSLKVQLNMLQLMLCHHHFSLQG